MDGDQVTAYGGIVGRVLRDATSLGTAVTSFILGAVVVAVIFIFSFIGNGLLAQILVQGVLALALARFALNGLSGEYRGTILSTAGGSWTTALMVAGRYLVLNLIWMAPLLFGLWLAITSAASSAAATLNLGVPGLDAAGAAPGAAMPDGAAPDGAAPDGGPSGAPMTSAGGLALMLALLAVLTSQLVISSVVLLLVGLTLLPPLFLIVSVRAERFADVFSAAQWRAAFSGRFADLYVIYAIHSGGLGMMIIMAIPIVLLSFSAAREFGILFAGAVFAYMCGLAVTLLGRLCGFFAFGDDARGPVRETAPAAGAHEAPPVVAPFKPRVVVVGVHPAPGRSAATRAPATDAAGIADAGMTDGGMPASEGAADKGGAVGGDDAGLAASEGGSALAADATEDIGTSGPPPLPDAVQRAAAARARFETDRDGALAELRSLSEEYAPSPPILHALTLGLQQAGRAAEALETARVALPLCLGSGQAALAAELFASLWKQGRELGLDHEQLDAVATVLMKAGDLARAVSAYGLALTMDPTDRKAIKGLLQAADQRLYKEGKPKDAAKIFTFLLMHSSASPFAEDMRRGLAEAEARLARVA